MASLGRDARPEVLGWGLLAQSLGCALAALAVEAARNGALTARPDEHAEVVEEGLRAVEVRLGPDLFGRPRDLDWLPAVQDRVAAWFETLGADAATARTLAGRLPGYFALALHQVWAAAPNTFGPVRDAIDTPFTRAAEDERRWRVYAARLDADLDLPLFGEAYSLRQLYQPLRGYWEERPEGGRKRDDGERALPVRHVVDLETALDEWLDDVGSPRRIVCGGPGSGKSSLAKHWAAKVAASETWRVLLIPLHLLDPGELRSSIKSTARSMHGITGDPFEAGNLLLVLDGLDELAVQGQSGLEAAVDVLNGVDRLIGQRGRDMGTIKVLVGGRNRLIEELGSRCERRGVLRVLPYRQGRRSDAGKETTRHRDLEEGCEWSDPEGRLAHDQREDWWRARAGLTGEDLAGMPPEIADNPRLADLARQPLLNHLLALVRAGGCIRLGPETSLNAVYADLLERVWTRSWGGGQRGALQGLSVEDFNLIFEEIGLALWQKGGGRSITAAEVERLAGLPELRAAFERFQQGAEKGGLGLLAAFYFREVGLKGQDRVFELTHKSFGEYLAARRLVRLVKELDEDMRQPRSSPEVVLLRWVRGTGTTGLTHPIAEFLREEIADVDETTAQSWHETLVGLMNATLRDGMPAHELRLATYREVEAYALHAEGTLLYCLNRCAARCSTKTTLDFGDERGWAIRRLLARLGHGGHQPALPITLEQLDLRRADLRRADLRGADLRGAHLRGADLSGADLRGADLSGAHLRGARNLTRKQILAVRELEGAKLPPEFEDLEEASSQEDDR